jgi:hypothetical protein
MATDIKKTTYIPGTHAKKRSSVEQQASIYFREWEKTQIEIKAFTE